MSKEFDEWWELNRHSFSDSTTRSVAINAWRAALKEGEEKRTTPTLRDQFAMAAMSGCLDSWDDAQVRSAYRMADAMLKEREK